MSLHLANPSSIVKLGTRLLRNRAAMLAAVVALAPSIARADEPPQQEEAEALQTGAPKATNKKNPAALPPKKGDKADKADKDEATKDGAKDAKKEKEPTVEEKALKGIVVVERSGQTLALGGVLAGDGRILTALSPLGPGNDLDVRFTDGSTVKVKLGHHDRMWDLALLVPQSGKWPDGLVASSKEPVRQDASIHSFTLAKGKPSVSTMILRSHKTFLGGDDKQLDNAIEIGSRVSPTDLGAPVIDEDGRVVAVLGRGCAPNEKGPCTPVAFGAPIAAIKAFLRTVPATAVAPSAWLGIQGVAETSGVAKGVRVLVVHPESPADEAKLKGGEKTEGDVILAVDGVPVTTPEGLADAIHAHGIGEKVPIMVLSQGKYRTVSVTLRAAPATPKQPTAAPANPAELPPPDAPAAPAPKKPGPPPKKK